MRGTRNARDILGIPARGTLCRVAVGAPDPENFRGFCEKCSAPPFLRGKTGVCGPRYLSRIRDGGRTFLERARAKRTFSTENSHFTSFFYDAKNRRPSSRRGRGGKPTKREPWASALSGKKYQCRWFVSRLSTALMKRHPQKFAEFSRARHGFSTLPRRGRGRPPGRGRKEGQGEGGRCQYRGRREN